MAKREQRPYRPHTFTVTVEVSHVLHSVLRQVDLDAIAHYINGRINGEAHVNLMDVALKVTRTEVTY